MIVLSKEQIIYLHEELINETGGMHGLKDEGLLDSALAVPFQSFEDQDLYPPPTRRPQGWDSVSPATTPSLMETKESAHTRCSCFWNLTASMSAIHRKSCPISFLISHPERKDMMNFLSGLSRI